MRGSRLAWGVRVRPKQKLKPLLTPLLRDSQVCRGTKAFQVAVALTVQHLDAFLTGQILQLGRKKRASVGAENPRSCALSEKGLGDNWGGVRWRGR